MYREGDDTDRRFLNHGTALLRLADVPDRPGVEGGRLSVLGVAPTFDTPCVLTFDDRLDTVDASLVVVRQESFWAACCGETVDGPAADFADVSTVPPGLVPTVRQWGRTLDARELGGPRGNWRDGTLFYLRILGTDPLWACLDNPRPAEFPTYMTLLSAMAEVAARTFHREPVRSYLANVMRGARGTGKPRRPA